LKKRKKYKNRGAVSFISAFGGPDFYFGKARKNEKHKNAASPKKGKKMGRG
jgi:hypothetical protein